MKTHSKIALSIVFLGVLAVTAYKFVIPFFESSAQLQSSDGKDIKAKLVIGMDSWIGYFPLCSREMLSAMRADGVLLQCVDDNANYQERFEKLKNNTYQLAVSTIDAYLLNGRDFRYPGVIISVLDESKGGDAIIANRDKIKSLDNLKLQTDIKIAFTPDSPSDHLLKSVGAHFDIPMLKDKKGNWRQTTNGSEEARQQLMNGSVDVAVLWEPDVSKALNDKRFTKIIGTEDTQGLIVDILLASRQYAQENPEIINILLKNYFRVLKSYRDQDNLFIKAFSTERKVKTELVEKMINGVRFSSLYDNAGLWYGIANNLPDNQERIIPAIESTLRVLINHGDFSTNPVKDQNYYILTNKEPIRSLYESTVSVSGFGNNKDNIASNKERTFSPISDLQWDNLREVGTLKVRPIIYQSGSDNLTYDGKTELDLAAENLKHYPNYRLIIKGHTGTRGDSKANIKLSQQRAESVQRYLEVAHSIDRNRMRAVGFGGRNPIQQRNGESYRNYQLRLSRVELNLVTENL